MTMQIITRQTAAFVGAKEQVVTPHSIILTDLDGTLLPLIHDPSKRFMDPQAQTAFALFSSASHNNVIPITGRDWEQVIQCFHKVTPSFPVISSNGAQLHRPGQTEITHSFTVPETDFLREMREAMRNFGAEHPELVTEVKRFEIGFHSEATTGHGHCPRDRILELANKCEALLQTLEKSAQGLGLNFTVASTEVTAQEMSHRGIDKLRAVIESFTDHLPTSLRSDDWTNVIYCGDSLLKGNDRIIATEVRNRGGRVFQVINGAPERIPPKDDVAHPHQAFYDPAALGAYLLQQVENLQRAPFFHRVRLPGNDR